ncbi:MAG: IclR family transcriptional regulator [Alphaproteobacteria bacterium]
MTERRSIYRTDTLADSKIKSGRAPAVTSAVQILKFLAFRRAEAGVSELARELKLNKSTCFNVLNSLVHGQLLVKDPIRATYRLGPGLVEIGTASRRNFSRRAVYRRAVQPFVDEAGITCLISQPLGDFSGIVVVDRVLPTQRKDDLVLAPIGQRYPISAPAMGCSVLSHLDEDEALEILRGQSGGWLAGKEGAEVTAYLRDIRKIGFATSHEEFELGVNAVASCVLGRRGEFAAVLCLIGATRDLPADQITDWGRRLTRLTRELEQIAVDDRSVTEAI